MRNDYLLDGRVTARADTALNNGMVKKLWRSFSLNCSELEFTEGRPFTFVLGDIQLPELEADKEYALCVEENGAAVIGKD